MTNVFKPIRPKKISEEIVEQIKELITQGELTPGKRIPSERELASFLGVSRPSVREAIMVLEAMGYLESRQGGGTYVRSLAENSLADPLAMLMSTNDPRMMNYLIEVRMGIEAWGAYLAAQRATDSDIATLRELLAVMEQQSSDGGWDADIDAEFHYSLMAATHNTLQMHIMNTIQGLFRRGVEFAHTQLYPQEGLIDLLKKQHREIVEAIAEHDPDRARQMMLNHLTLVQKNFAQLYSETPPEPA